MKCLSFRKVVTRSMSELVYVLYGLSGAEVPSLLLLNIQTCTCLVHFHFKCRTVLLSRHHIISVELYISASVVFHWEGGCGRPTTLHANHKTQTLSTNHGIHILLCLSLHSGEFL